MHIKGSTSSSRSALKTISANEESVEKPTAPASARRAKANDSFETPAVADGRERPEPVALPQVEPRVSPSPSNSRVTLVSVASSPSPAVSGGPGPSSPVIPTRVTKPPTPAAPQSTPALAGTAGAPAVGKTFSKDGVSFVVLGTAPDARLPGTLLFNHDETLTRGELANTWTNVSANGGLTPTGKTFNVMSAHNNGSRYPMEVGVGLTNTGTTPMRVSVVVSRPTGLAGATGPNSVTPGAPWQQTAAPTPPRFTATYATTIAPGASVTMPLGRVDASKDPNNRTSTSTAIVGTCQVQILSGGNPASLRVADLARHVGSDTKKPQWAGDKTHHEGVFAAQRPTSPGPTLTAGTGVRLEMPNVNGNYAYGTPCVFQVGIPAGARLEVRGVGGKAIVTPPPRPGEGVIRGTTSITVEEGVRTGFLTPLRDSNGKPLMGGTPPAPQYEINVQWQPGSFGGLDVFVKPPPPPPSKK